MISLIAAMSKNYVIGNDGIIPWHIKGEQKRFKKLTMGKTIIMGRKSFEEIGFALPDRKTIVISSTVEYRDQNVKTVRSLNEALELTIEEDEVFIAGGGRVYQESLHLADFIYLTEIDIVIEGDTYFPKFDKTKYNITYKNIVDGDIPYTYYTYERKI